jgi:hypothetical protein
MELNPFTPNFGQVPYVLAGRDSLLSEITSAYNAGYNDPALTSLLIGPRGSGKTALMSLLADEASQMGWVCVNAACVSGLLAEIYQGTLRSAKNFINTEASTHLKSIGLGDLLSFEWEHSEKDAPTWRIKMENILDDLTSQGIGVLMTIDEIDPALPELVRLISTYQLFIRENYKVALLMAGLPSQVSMLLNEKSITFLRRASQYHLKKIPQVEVELAIEKTITEGGKTISPEALSMTTQASEGFPFMLQLVGFRTWQASGENTLIDDISAEKGIERARQDLTTRVLDATFRDLSEGDISFLTAMMEDSETSRIADIVKRLGKSDSYVSQYRLRLLEQGVIDTPARGRVEFAMPFFKEYLKEHL